ncbi:mRNA capping enzyme [Guillardia theta]|uniref:mRNA guanylyltransferase n=1 Tax=Guillardia theta TaxID=55529 RepID=Q9AVW1_GUITH|nr:mRNA capping enzyme [Guillardia theta]CAC27110.1 mRNA capping enzyme [Guillardia theta]|mmetsp:Transcript_20159/g.67403  ORF Transcript_20159/g.67403 Transcript_20159/m.67403 type:complete len:358 (+) Transcript_20159:202-1275(+)
MNILKCKHKFKKVYKLNSVLSGLPKHLICSECFFFIGNMPINISRNQLKFFFKNDYGFFEKTDGFRFILLISKKFYLIDRKNKIFVLKNFKNPNYLEGYYCFDGELCFDFISQSYIYLIYDFLVFKNDWRISTWDLSSRMHFSTYFVKILNLNLKNIFFFNVKSIMKLFQLEIFFESLIENLYSSEKVYYSYLIFKIYCTKIDGVVFSSNNISYSTNRPLNNFKWKFGNLNTVDMKLNYCYTKTSKNLINYLLCKINKSNNMRIFKIKKKSFANIENNLNESIYEFIFDKQYVQWVYYKIRKDKFEPNSFRTLLDTLYTISSNVGLFEISNYLKKNTLKTMRGKVFKSNVFENYKSL